MSQSAFRCPESVDQLEDLLSAPTPVAIETLTQLSGDIIVLGVGGKMGPTLARMAKRASDECGASRRVIGVARFSEAGLQERLQSWGVETIAGDLLDERFVSGLPDAPNVVYMAGFKFGASAAPSMTWAMNCVAPALVSRRYRDSRIAAFSTGNVYGLVSTDSSGSVETDEPNPVGEYAMAALGRERIFEHFSLAQGTPMTMLRLNYATELRYGVLVDLAQQVWNGQPIDVTMGSVNVIWQAEANAMSLAALSHTSSPPRVVNISGREVLKVRAVAEQLGELLDRPVAFFGDEAPDALVSDGALGHKLLGQPTVSADDMIGAAADWVRRGGETLGKPTKFQSREGKF